MHDNKLEKGENFRVEGSLDSDAVSKDSPEINTLEEDQKDFDMDTPSGIAPNKRYEEKDIETEMKRSSTENGNGASVSNP